MVYEITMLEDHVYASEADSVESLFHHDNYNTYERDYKNNNSMILIIYEGRNISSFWKNNCQMKMLFIALFKYKGAQARGGV